MTSTRLPGKVMLPLGGQPMLARLVERLRRAHRVDTLVIATTTNASDDVIARLCAQLEVTCYRGSEQNVLRRYAEAAAACGASDVVRVTSDCPLMDPVLVDRVLDVYARGGCDYVGNMRPPTWPYGMAVEVMRASALFEAQREAIEPAEREHVTPFIYWRPERYRLGNVASAEDLSEHRWTIDTPQDYELVTRLFDAMYPSCPEFSLEDVLATMRQHPDWMAINQHVRQKTAQPGGAQT